VVWLVLGIGLYRDRSIRDVCDKLDIALAQARARLGEDPYAICF
jgi:hypothetical protein